MPDNQNRTTELELSRVVLEILAEMPNGSAAISQLIGRIPQRIALTAEDLAQSETRPNEAVWEQRVRNITSHKNTPGNYIYEGFLEQIAGGLRITEAGRLHLQHS